MSEAAARWSGLSRRLWFPPARWLREYRLAWLPHDVVAGLTLATYAIPVSLAYATLAGLPPHIGIYGYLLGGLGYVLFGTSKHLAIGPTSAISLMIAGTVGVMADGDTQRYAQIASLTGFTLAALCLMSWWFGLSALVKLISDSILVGFKIGAGLTIAMTQLPGLFGVAGGGHNVLSGWFYFWDSFRNHSGSYLPSEPLRSCCLRLANVFYRGNRLRSGLWRFRSSLQPCWACPRWACRSPA
jgi:sulfate permease, SulP family